MSNLMQQLEIGLKNSGFSLTIGSVNHLNDLRQDLEKPFKAGLIGKTFFQERLSDFIFTPDEYNGKLNSIIVTAAPQTQQETIFWIQGKAHHFFIPPTYSNQSDNEIEKIILDTIEPYGFSITPAIIPLKIAAVRLGLARYGRNNITYCEGMGSYFRLKAFLSDYPVYEDHWHEFELIQQCENCNACLQSCPTGAIRSERILLQSDKCLTYHNERPGEFPSWIEKSWHNCLIGCLKCQTVCPMNNKIDIRPNKAVEFSEEETMEFLNAVDEQNLPGSVVTKLKELSLFEDWPLLARNLRVMLR